MNDGRGAMVDGVVGLLAVGGGAENNSNAEGDRAAMVDAEGVELEVSNGGAAPPARGA